MLPGLLEFFAFRKIASSKRSLCCDGRKEVLPSKDTEVGFFLMAGSAHLW